MLAVILNFFTSYSQTAPGIEWQNTIGGSGSDQLNSIFPTPDGGWICGGSSSSSISGDKTENNLGMEDYWVVKLDASGNVQWENTIGGDWSDYLESIFPTSDNGYICGGWSASDATGDKTENSLGQYDYWIVKLDSAGNIQWQNTIGGDDWDFLLSISQTADGGYVCGGHSFSNISGDKTEINLGGIDFWVVKLDSSGNIEWQNTIGGSGGDWLYSVSQTPDGGYICGGISSSGISGDKSEANLGGKDVWIVKLDNTGNITWQNTIGGNDGENTVCVSQTLDGGFICVNRSYSNISFDKTENSLGGSDFWVIKLDSTGLVQWENTIGGNDEEGPHAIFATPDSGYICGGWSNSNISFDKSENSFGFGDYWILKLDATGSITWQKTIGGDSIDFMHSMTLSTDGGFVCAGLSYSNISGNKTENCLGVSDYFVVKLYPDTITFIHQLPDHSISLAPNPFSYRSKLSFANPGNEKFLFTVSDITGRITDTVNTSSNEIILTSENKPAGIYLFNLVNENTGERWSGKVLITY